MSGL
jgi:tripartite motif-containing protein 71